MELLPDWSILEASKEELTSAEKFVLMVVKLHIGKNKYATVSHECIADETSLTRQTVLKLINSLDRKKWITTTKRKHKNNGYVCHEYRLNRDKLRLLQKS
jgi:predicted transcriptional regulator